MKRQFISYCCGFLITSSSHRSVHPVTGLLAIRNRHHIHSIVYSIPNLQNRNRGFNSLSFQQQRRWQSFPSTLSLAAADQNNKVTPSVKPSTSTSTSDLSSSMHRTVKLLAEAWTPRLLKLERDNTTNQRDACEAAVQRTLPLFLQVKDNDAYYDATTAASVPFVCRYRTDIIHPLTTE
jgi:hypothetical protein